MKFTTIATCLHLTGALKINQGPAETLPLETDDDIKIIVTDEAIDGELEDNDIVKSISLSYANDDTSNEIQSEIPS